ncbi:MAG: type IV pili twitching motility protein PilT [Candidatus Cloacimonetes bacterium 4572_55]|nr:MAG: type IV pili twitching motility protein PilT [Candidatus Cloacimonetes bacterium 4572_55]
MQVDSLLIAMVKSGASDLHFKVGSPPLMRIDGQLVPAKYHKLTPKDTAAIANSLMDEHQKIRFKEEHAIDMSYSVPKLTRFRCNIFSQRGSTAIVLRVIPMKIPTLKELRLPPIIRKLALEHRGLVLVTGVTGSGKSSTLAGMVNEINNARRAHILTIEDPIEFLYSDKHSSINQREVGMDTKSFPSALRSALRQDPDVILVGEMRDAETIQIAIKAADTGHMVFSTLHTTNAAKTIDRIIDYFPPHQQQQIRFQLATNIRGIISQRLLRRADGEGRIVACEVMIGTATITDYITESGSTNKILDAIEAGKSQYGMQSFDQALIDLLYEGLITREVALANANNPNELVLKLDGIETV